MKVNPIILKIEKVLRLAAAQAGQPEGETAARLAARMMAAHSIAATDIDIGRDSSPDPISENVRDMGSRANWKRNLYNAVAFHCSCRISYRLDRCTLYGHVSDMEICDYLYEICERQIEVAAKKYVGTLPAVGGYRRTMGNNFKRSAVEGLSAKLYEIRKDVQSENSAGTALVLSRGDAVQRHLDAKNFKRGNTGRSAHCSDGYAAGRALSLAAALDASARGAKKKRIG